MGEPLDAIEGRPEERDPSLPADERLVREEIVRAAIHRFSELTPISKRLSFAATGRALSTVLQICSSRDSMPPDRGSVIVQVIKPKAISAMAKPARTQPQIRSPCG